MPQLIRVPEQYRTSFLVVRACDSPAFIVFGLDPFYSLIRSAQVPTIRSGTWGGILS